MQKLILVLVFVVASYAYGASQIKDICEQSDVHSFQRAINKNSAQSFYYHYRLIKAEKNNAPIVIFIPGGPGGTSIGNVDPRFAKDYSLVLTDPRGAGCNDFADITSKDISSEVIAGDLVHLIKQLHPHKYIIHGHSYGTVVATILSAKLAKEKITQPEAVILEGVFGQYWDQRKRELGLSSTWSKIFRSLSQRTQNLLSKTEQNPFGSRQDHWFQAIYQFLYLGKIHFLPYSYDDLLKNFTAKLQGKALPNDLKKLYSSINFGGLPSSEKTWNAIACNELFYSGEESLQYSYGKLSYESVKICPADRLRPFDSAKWQMKHKTVYFVGQNDPSTPEWQAHYHYDHQKNNQKIFIAVHDAGHRPFQLNLNDCADDLYKSLFEKKPLKSALRHCAAPVDIF